jgi:hypothetical protein
METIMNAVVPASMAIFARSRAARGSAALFCGARTPRRREPPRVRTKSISIY